LRRLSGHLCQRPFVTWPERWASAANSRWWGRFEAAPKVDFTRLRNAALKRSAKQFKVGAEGKAGTAQTSRLPAPFRAPDARRVTRHRASTEWPSALSHSISARDHACQLAPRGPVVLARHELPGRSGPRPDPGVPGPCSRQIYSCSIGTFIVLNAIGATSLHLINRTGRISLGHAAFRGLHRDDGSAGIRGPDPAAEPLLDRDVADRPCLCAMFEVPVKRPQHADAICRIGSSS